MTELILCRHPCSEAEGKPLCRHCERQARAWGDAMAALIDDGPDESEPVSPGELGHVRASGSA